MDPDEHQRALRAWATLITDWWELHRQPDLTEESSSVKPRKEPPR
jgi:hypothetical protein